MVQCTATAKRTGQQFKKPGDPSKGGRCHLHEIVFLCRGRKPNGSRCGSRAIDGYDGFCSAAHDPTKNRFNSQQFRLDDDEMRPLRALVRGDGPIVDVYTGQMLNIGDGECDHIVEVQMGAHVINRARAMYRGYHQEIENTIPVVREYLNKVSNLAYTHRDTNKLKGAGVKVFLDDRAYSLGANWTSSLLSAHDQLNYQVRQGLRVQRLQRGVTRSITKSVVKEIKHLQWNLDGEADNGSVDEIVHQLGILHVTIERT